MGASDISADALIKRVKSDPRIDGVGMILTHKGIVRASDRTGSRSVKGLTVTVDHEKIEQLRQWAETLPGIVMVLMEARDGEVTVGDDLLCIVVAGDIRENVLRAMTDVLNRAKSEAITKIEHYSDESP